MRVAVLFLLLAPLAALAQTTPAERPALHAYGLERTYRAILSETIVLQLAQTDSTQESDDGTDPVLGLGRLVVDETISRTGTYFYDVFFRLWRPASNAQFMSVTITERPLPGLGTLISVYLDGELVFQSRLSPREEEVETLAQQAVGATARRLPQG